MSAPPFFPNFDSYTPEEIPIGHDIYLRDVKDIPEYKQSFIDLESGKPWRPVGYVTRVAARHITENFVELSWYANVNDRFHELTIALPRNQILACIDSSYWDEKFSIFVNSNWLSQIHQRSHCVFGLIDAIGVRNAISEGLSIGPLLPELRNRLDEIASRHKQVSFISFADSIIIKGHWTAGDFTAGVKYTYDPELLLKIFAETKSVFKDILNLNTYGVFCQGGNEYNDSLLHISESGNHVCLNSLGAPFADIKSIEESARRAIKRKEHNAHELYLDEAYFHSLKLNFEFKESITNRYPYLTAMTRREAYYVCTNYNELITNLEKGIAL